MEIRKNDEFELTIEDMSEDGAGIGKQDGYIWFVKDAVIGDRIRARAMKMKKNYGFARLMEVLEASKDRVMPECPVARQCGGCQLQAMSYEEQLKFKERKVKNHLLRIGKFKEDEIHMLPIMGMKEPWRYRNKAQFPFGLDKNGNFTYQKCSSGPYSFHRLWSGPNRHRYNPGLSPNRILFLLHLYKDETLVSPIPLDCSYTACQTGVAAFPCGFQTRTCCNRSAELLWYRGYHPAVVLWFRKFPE